MFLIFNSYYKSGKLKFINASTFRKMKSLESLDGTLWLAILTCLISHLSAKITFTHVLYDIYVGRGA